MHISVSPEKFGTIFKLQLEDQEEIGSDVVLAEKFMEKVKEGDSGLNAGDGWGGNIDGWPGH